MKKFILLAFICAAIFFGDTPIEAQNLTFDLSSSSINKGYMLTEQSVPYIDPDGDGRTDLSDYLAGLFRLMIGIAAVGSIVVIIIGGFEYIASATPFGKTEGKKRIQNAFWGLGIVLFSYLIINTINPAILQFNPDTIIPTLVVQKDIFLSNQDQYERRLLALGIKSREVYNSLVPYSDIEQWEKEAKEAEDQLNPQLAAELLKKATDARSFNIKTSAKQIVENYIVRYDTLDQDKSWTINDVRFQKQKLSQLLQDDIDYLRQHAKHEYASHLENLKIYGENSLDHIIGLIELQPEWYATSILYDHEKTEREAKAKKLGDTLYANIIDPELKKQFRQEAAERLDKFIQNN